MRLRRAALYQHQRRGSYETPAGYREMEPLGPAWAAHEEQLGEVRLHRDIADDLRCYSSATVFRDQHAAPWRWNVVAHTGNQDRGYVILDGDQDHADEGDAAQELEAFLAWWCRGGADDSRRVLLSEPYYRWHKLACVGWGANRAIIVHATNIFWEPRERVPVQLSAEWLGILTDRVTDHRRERGWR